MFAQANMQAIFSRNLVEPLYGPDFDSVLFELNLLYYRRNPGANW